ncbi:MAG: major capsid protein [FCB group bacterium]|jgi:hypothetical protein|nr:major capsid protein [FCB group bacterium]
MAAFTRDTFVVFDDQFQTGMWERIAQNTQAFNVASNNALVLQSESLKGDYSISTIFEKLNEDAITRRDPSSLSVATAYDIEQLEVASVNLHRRFGPVKKTLNSWYQIGQTPEMLSMLVGQMAGDLKAAKMVNTLLSAVTAALSGQSDIIHDATGASTKTLTTDHLVSGMSKMGDAFQRLACWVMHSKPYFNLVGNQVADKMDSVAGLIVYGGTPATLGKPVVVIDSPALTDGATAPIYSVLGLVQGAGVIKDHEQGPVAYDVVTGLENLMGVVQSEFMLSVGVKGFTWDVLNGGANPTDADLATSGNWDVVASSLKDAAGVLIKVQ